MTGYIDKVLTLAKAPVFEYVKYLLPSFHFVLLNVDTCASETCQASDSIYLIHKSRSSKYRISKITQISF